MTQLSDEKLRTECEDLDLSHGPTRLLAAALYWRRTAVERKARADALEAALRELAFHAEPSNPSHYSKVAAACKAARALLEKT